MMNKRFAVLFVIAVAFVGHAAAQTCTPYDQLPAPSSPGELMQDLDAALKNGCQVWKWRNWWTANHQSFSNFDAGSQNLPVVAGAIALIRKDHIQLGNTTHVATLVGVISNGGTRFYVPMHFVGWNDGARLSYLDYHSNNNPGGTVYALKFEPVPQRAHLHYPFHASKNGPYRVANFGRVLIGTNLNPGCGFPTSQHLETWNQPCSTPAPSGDCKHEERRLWMPMPTSTKIDEVVIDQAGAQSLLAGTAGCAGWPGLWHVRSLRG